MEETNSPKPPSGPEPEEAPPETPGPPQATGGIGGLKLPDRLDFLRNRLILGGLAFVALLLLITIILVVLGTGDAGPERQLVADAASTPDSESTVVPRIGLGGRVLTTVTVRSGPGHRYAILGTIPGGASVHIIGRNADDTWFQVVYPPGSSLRGWVDAEFVEVTGDLSQLTIAGPSAGPSVPRPTRPAPVVEEPPRPSPTTPPLEPTATLPPVPPTATQPPAPPTATPPGPPTATPPPPTAQPTPTPAETPERSSS